jgi:hypothetical protein
MAVIFLAGIPLGCTIMGGGSQGEVRNPAVVTIPDLAWVKRSDWIDVKTDVSPAAKGDGIADDTAALQKALDGVKDGSVIYLPAGTYRITNTLRMTVNRPPSEGPQHRVLGLLVIGHGRNTKLVWDGPAGKEMLVESGATMSRCRGLLFDGRGKATVGLHHLGAEGTFETEVGHRDMAFLNFTDAGILADICPATAEVMIENCLFEACKRGIALLTWNMYDYTIDGCEFRRCETAIDCLHGNVYIRNCHFEGSTGVDMALNPEHGSSVRRCTSSGSRMFIRYNNSVAPLTIQDCQVAGWTNPEGAISLHGAPVAMFDCVFTRAPGTMPPVLISSTNQRFFVSQNVSSGTNGVYTPKVGKVYDIPAGQRKGTLTSANQRFLRDTAAVPAVVFDAKRDFGAKGDRKTDDTAAIQKAIDAARQHGKGAIAYLPTGFYVVKSPLRVTGANYTFGGTGYRAALLWGGAKDGNIVEVLDPDDVTMENIAIGNWEPAAQYAADILQTSTGNKPSSMTYDNVSVFGMYSRQPFVKGLVLQGLSKDSTVLVRHVEGNIHLVDAARATVLLGNSYEGSVVVEGKSKQRDGFLGILSRLGTSCTHALYVKDNHSLVASDFYIEQADNGFSLEGSPEDPPGRITLQTPKLHMSQLKEGKENVAFDIRGYHGQIHFGPAQFYIDPKLMRVTQTGTSPVEIMFWANSFYNTTLVVQKAEAARVWRIGGTGVAAETLNDVTVEDTSSPDVLTKLVPALDDLRALGELDLRLNHPDVLQ